MQRLGTAEWARPDTFAERHAFQVGKFWLGRSPVGGGTPIGYVDDRHVCLVSGSRSGKGTSVIINNLCLWPGSVVVIDPKGENASVTAARRGTGSAAVEGMGQKVHVLDPFEAAHVAPEVRSRFNPMDALDPAREETIDEAARLANAIVIVRPESHDPFWDEAARALVKGLILYVLTADEFEGRRNLLTVRQLLLRGDVDTVEVLRRDGMEEKDIPTAQELLWEGLSRSEAFGDVVAGVGDNFRNMAVNSPKQFESVLQIANTNTEFLDSPGMRRCLESSDFSLRDLKTDPKGVSVYLCLPQRYMATHYRWLRMMISLTVTEMEATKGQPASGHPVLLVLDEFAGLKRMEVIENAVAQIAGFGVKLFFVLQSLEQLKGTYKDHWETFLSNAGLKIFFGVEDHFSREYVSKLIGETEVVREVRSDTATEGVTEGTSRNFSRSKSRSKSKNWGGNKSSSSTSGTSKGESWKQPSPFFFRNSARYFAFLRKEEGVSYGTNSSRTTGGGESWGSSISDTEGTTEGHGTSESRSTSSARGKSETLHKRPLINPDEIGQFFTRVTDKSNPLYPGLGLVVISGEQPGVVRRANYFEDFEFLGRFERHPDHPLPAWQDIEVALPAAAILSFLAPSVHRIEGRFHVIEGGRVRKGDVLLSINLADSAWAGEYESKDLRIHSPASGFMKSAGRTRKTDYRFRTFLTETGDQVGERNPDGEFSIGKSGEWDYRYLLTPTISAVDVDYDRQIETENLVRFVFRLSRNRSLPDHRC